MAPPESGKRSRPGRARGRDDIGPTLQLVQEPDKDEQNSPPMTEPSPERG